MPEGIITQGLQAPILLDTSSTLFYHGKPEWYSWITLFLRLEGNNTG